MSYSQIKEQVSVSKSTLSTWLDGMPLSRERVNELRANSERRIERCRETKARNRETRLSGVSKEVASNISEITQRELYLLGLALYWAEGTKAARGAVYVTNTDPAMLSFFMRWLVSLGVPKENIRCRLHLYTDMDISQETTYWAKSLGLSKQQFRPPYVKPTDASKRKNYKGRFGHGTCNLFVYDISLYEKVMAGVEFLRSGAPLSNAV